MSWCHNERAHPDIANDDGYIDWGNIAQARKVVAIGPNNVCLPGGREIGIGDPAPGLDARDCFWCSEECFASWVAAKVVEDWANESRYQRAEEVGHGADEAAVRRAQPETAEDADAEAERAAAAASDGAAVAAGGVGRLVLSGGRRGCGCGEPECNAGAPR